MSNFFDDTMQGLLEAVEIEKGNVPLSKRSNMPTDTLFVPDGDGKLIDEIINIRNQENISQIQLAELIGSKQQSISRIEKKEHSPSLKLFYSIVSALGYDIMLVKKGNKGSLQGK